MTEGQPSARWPYVTPILISPLSSVANDVWNAVVCFQPPCLLIGKVWVPVKYFCTCPIHCKVHWRVGRRVWSCRLISVQPFIGSTIRAFYISSALWALEVLCCLYWYRSYQTDHSTLWWMVVGVLINVISGVPQGSVLARYCSSCTFRSFFDSGK